MTSVPPNPFLVSSIIILQYGSVHLCPSAFHNNNYLIYIINFHWGDSSFKGYLCQHIWDFVRGLQELQIFNKWEVSLMISKKTLLQTGRKDIPSLKIFSKYLGVGSGEFLSCNLKSRSHSNWYLHIRLALTEGATSWTWLMHVLLCWDTCPPPTRLKITVTTIRSKRDNKTHHH